MLANFVNGELYGRAVASDFPLAMVFPTDPDQLPRHPSQLYQAGFEGLLLGLLLLALFWQTRARYRPGLLVAVFTIGMGLGRFLMEFFREPDAHLAYMVVETGLSRGQWLSLPMILIGVVVLVYALLRPATGSAGAGKTRPA